MVLQEHMPSVVDVNSEGRAPMERIIESWITRVENFYSLQSIPVKVLIFIVGIYALGTLILGPIYWAGQKFGETIYNYLF